MLYILLADGFEEIEMITPLDMIKRANIPVQTVGISGKTVMGAHNIEITADILPDQVDTENIDGVILPGGMPGTLNLQKDEKVNELIELCEKKSKLIGAICAAPMILGEKGLLQGKKAVCFPGFEENLKGATVQKLPVATDGNIITSRGAGAALWFGSAIIDYLKGAGEGEKILAQMQTPDYV